MYEHLPRILVTIWGKPSILVKKKWGIKVEHFSGEIKHNVQKPSQNQSIRHSLTANLKARKK